MGTTGVVKESTIQSEIIDFLQLFENQGKLFYQRTNNTAVYDPNGGRFRSRAKGQKKGWPDIIVLMPKRTIGLEVKTASGRVSTDQQLMKKMFEKQGKEYHVVRSVQDVKFVLGV